MTTEDADDEDFILEDEIRDLTAYLPDDIQKEAQELVAFIDDLDDFEQEVEEDEFFDKLNFIDKDSGLTVAQVRFSEDEDEAQFYCRDEDGDLTQIANLHHKKDPHDTKKHIKAQYQSIRASK